MADRKYVFLEYEPGTEEPVYKYTEDILKKVYHMRPFISLTIFTYSL